MADVLQFPVKPPNPGNGALEVMHRYFADEVAVSPDTHPSGLRWPDHVLVWLWNEGFKVVPLEKNDETAS